jgi:hypothetical protein
MKNFVDYTSRKCFACARVASPRLRNITHTRTFSGLVIQITNAGSSAIQARLTPLPETATIHPQKQCFRYL